MKLSLFLIALVLTIPSFAQNDTHVGIKTGLNLAMFSASINSSPTMKAGFHVGFYLRTGKNEKFKFRPELYFSSQGQKDNYETASGQSLGKTTTTVNAINLPLLFEAGRKVTFQFGPQVGILLSGREKGTIMSQKVDDDLKEHMNSADFGFVVGLGVNATENLNLGVRYNLGLTSIFERPDGASADDFPKVANRVLHFHIGYTFSKKQVN